MTRSRGEFAWQFISVAVVDVLNPLLLIASALFMSVGYILTRLMPAHIDIWAALLWFSVLLPLFPLLQRARRRWLRNPPRPERSPWRRVLPALPILILSLAAPAILGSPTLNSISHIDIYFVYVRQLYTGIAPPENIFMPGFPANHYWMYHALVAAILRVTAADTYSVFNLLNLIFLLSSLLWLAKTLVALGLGKPRSIYLGILILFVFGAVNLTGILSVVHHVIQGTFGEGGLDKMLLPGADRRLHNVFAKTFHASGMTPGILAFIVALYCCVRALKQRTELYHLILLSGCGILALGAMPVIVVFLVLTMFGAVALTALLVRLTARRGAAPDAFHMRSSLAALGNRRFIIWLLASLALALPLLQYAGDLSYSSQDMIGFLPFNETNVKMSLAAQAILLLLALPFLFLERRRKRSEHIFLLMSIAIGLFIALGLSLPDLNQYKVHFLLAMLVALAWLFALSEIRGRGGTTWRRVGNTVMAALILLSFCNLLYAQYHVVARALWQHDPVRFVGVGVKTDDLNKYGGRIPAYYWIAENTPANSIIILDRNLGSAANLYHERLSYVSRDPYFYIPSMPVYGQRIQEMGAFFDAQTRGEDYQALLASMQEGLPGRPLYAVVRDDEVPAADMAARGALQVFAHPAAGGHVYWLNP